MSAHLPARARRLALLASTSLLVTAPAAFAGGTVASTTTFTYTGTPGEDNVVNVTFAADTLTVTDTGGAPFSAPAPLGCTLSNGNRTIACSTALNSQGAEFDLGDGSDTITFGVTTGAPDFTIDGEAGEDILNGSEAADTISGGADDDDIKAAGGNDVITGGTGADSLRGGSGTDTITYPSGTNTITLDGAANDGTAGEGDNAGGIVNDVENVTGGTGADTITGNTAENLLVGGAGNDVLDGGLADDTLTGGANTDTVTYATRTADQPVTATNLTTVTVANPAEEDTLATVENLTGGAGDDSFTGVEGANVLDGGAGDDTLLVGPEATTVGDTYIGGTGLDSVSYASRTDAAAGDAHTITLDDVADDGLTSGEGDDVRSSVETVTGTSAADTITGADAANTLNGGPGADTLRGGAGNDLLDGGAGNDSLDGGADADMLVGGGNTDTATYATRSTPVTVTLGSMGTTDDGGTEDGAVGARDDVQTENVTGGTAGDTLTGDGFANGLSGGAGDDTLDGGLGADVLAGDGDTDTVTYASRMNAVLVTIDGNVGDGELAEGDNVATTVENVTGGSAGDTITGSASANLLRGGNGTDTLDGAAGADTLDGGEGDDVLEGSTNTDTVIYADRTTPVVVTLGDGLSNDGETAAAEADTLTTIENATGGAAGDTLTGSTAVNVLTGGAGNDVLNGGTGLAADTLDGGANTDTASYTGRTEALGLSLDDTVNDGADTELDVLTAVESLTGGDGGDTISGNAAVNVLTGGDGADAITSRDSVADTVNCGPGTPDTVTGDLNDAIDGSCETVDRGPVPALTVQDVSIDEGDSGSANATLTVTASPAPTATATVDYATNTAGTATAGTDFTATSGTLTFAAGDTSETITVPIAGDALVEADETIKVAFSNPVNATAPAGPATVTITNDDTFPTVSIGDATKAEAATPATFTATLSKTYPEAVTVTATTSNGTAVAPGDYTARTAGITIPAGQTTGTFDVALIDDAFAESAETFTVTLSAPSKATVADGTATGTITDDDTAPVLTIADAAVTEGNSGSATLKLPVTASKASDTAITVKATTTDGTATAGTDYAALSDAVVTIPAGQTTADVEVPVTGDTTAEPNETLTVTLSAPTGATLDTDTTATGTITNDDTAPPAPTPTPAPTPATPVVSVTGATVTEGSSGDTPAPFTVRLSAATTGTVRVAYRTADNTATAGSDYRSTTGTLTFAAGETTKVVPVPVIGDTTAETDETFGFVLSSPENATLADPALAVGTVRDDDNGTAPVSRKRPKVSLRVKPARDRTKPYAFALSGRLTLPSGVNRAGGCTGKVVITVKRANTRTVKAYTATLRSACTYKVTAKLPASVRPASLKATARFGGNAALLPARSAARSLRAG